jgi:lipopolysaccharide/colanic/teichoic acid biosynthesis glycosyltransferase
MAAAKRVFDAVISLALLAPAALITLIAAPFVWLETRADPLFRQQRVGRDGKRFTMLKIRTMRAGTPDGASHEIGASTITRSGHLLRRTKLDELPQLWNVLVGDMSLVGPRPCLPSQSELIEERRRRGVLALRPGVTGVAQLAGLDMSDPQRLAQADAAYVGAWSVVRDIRILARTATGRGSGDAARSR